MRDLFHEIIAEGEPALRRLITERRQEVVDLEFKTKADPSRATLSDDERRVLGKVLSAFSNSMGGLVIYGVDARKNDDDIDCASELQPIVRLASRRNPNSRIMKPIPSAWTVELEESVSMSDVTLVLPPRARPARQPSLYIR